MFLYRTIFNTMLLVIFYQMKMQVNFGKNGIVYIILPLLGLLLICSGICNPCLKQTHPLIFVIQLSSSKFVSLSGSINDLIAFAVFLSAYCSNNGKITPAFFFLTPESFRISHQKTGLPPFSFLSF